MKPVTLITGKLYRRGIRLLGLVLSLLLAVEGAQPVMAAGGGSPKTLPRHSVSVEPFDAQAITPYLLSNSRLPRLIQERVKDSFSRLLDVFVPTRMGITVVADNRLLAPFMLDRDIPKGVADIEEVATESNASLLMFKLVGLENRHLPYYLHDRADGLKIYAYLDYALRKAKWQDRYPNFDRLVFIDHAYHPASRRELSLDELRDHLDPTVSAVSIRGDAEGTLVVDRGPRTRGYYAFGFNNDLLTLLDQPGHQYPIGEALRNLILQSLAAWELDEKDLQEGLRHHFNTTKFTVHIGKRFVPGDNFRKYRVVAQVFNHLTQGLTLFLDENLFAQGLGSENVVLFIVLHRELQWLFSGEHTELETLSDWILNAIRHLTYPIFDAALRAIPSDDAENLADLIKYPFLRKPGQNTPVEELTEQGIRGIIETYLEQLPLDFLQDPTSEQPRMLMPLAMQENVCVFHDSLSFRYSEHVKDNDGSSHRSSEIEALLTKLPLEWSSPIPFDELPAPALNRLHALAKRALDAAWSQDAIWFVILTSVNDLVKGWAKRTPDDLIFELITNAMDAYIEAKRNGAIDVKVFCGDRNWTIEVSDNGVGLPKGLRDKGVPDGLTSGWKMQSHIGGGGVGLTIGDILARLHGGRLEFVSNPPGSKKFMRTTVRLVLPLTALSVPADWMPQEGLPEPAGESEQMEESWRSGPLSNKELLRDLIGVSIPQIKDPSRLALTPDEEKLFTAYSSPAKSPAIDLPAARLNEFYLKIEHHLQLQTATEEGGAAVLAAPVEWLPLSQRAQNGLRNAGIQTIEELANKTEPELQRMKNSGQVVRDEIKRTLGWLGLSLGMRQEGLDFYREKVTVELPAGSPRLPKVLNLGAVAFVDLPKAVSELKDSSRLVLTGHQKDLLARYQSGWIPDQWTQHLAEEVPALFSKVQFHLFLLKAREEGPAAVLAALVEWLPLPTALLKHLEEGGIKNILDLTVRTSDQLLDVEGIGSLYIRSIQDVLAWLNLRIGVRRLTRAELLNDLDQNRMQAGLHTVTGGKAYETLVDKPEDLAALAKTALDAGLTVGLDQLAAVRIVRQDPYYDRKPLIFLLEDHLEKATEAVTAGVNILQGRGWTWDVVQSLRQSFPEILIIADIAYDGVKAIEDLKEALFVGVDGVLLKPHKAWNEVPDGHVISINALRRRYPDLLIAVAGGIFETSIASVLARPERLLAAVGTNKLSLLEFIAQIKHYAEIAAPFRPALHRLSDAA